MSNWLLAVPHKVLSRQRSERHNRLGPSEIDTGRLPPDRQRGRMSDAEPPMETGGN
jgi:hypothetical protein